VLEITPVTCIKIYSIVISCGGVEPRSLVPRPLNGLLYQPQMVISAEQSVECLADETEALGENLS
jgi:hypothetical protein